MQVRDAIFPFACRPGPSYCASRISSAIPFPKSMKPEKPSSRKPVAGKKTNPKKDAPEAPKPAASEAKPAKKVPEIPAILLEGDSAPAAPASGPGHRYALGPTASHEKSSAPAALPDSYGTRKLLLTARDPHWLYAHWDLSQEQLKKYNQLSADRHLVLRIFKNEHTGEPFSQIHVHPESRNWFVPVDAGSTRYLGELGYFDKASKWNSISISPATLTPPDSLSEDTTVRFATIPSDVPFEQLLSLVKEAIRQHVPLLEAIQQLRAAGHKDLPKISRSSTTRWTPEQEKALASVVTMDQVRRVWIGSLEITELIRRQLFQDLSSITLAQLPTSPGGAVSSIGSLSSAFGGVARRKGFWFNVNAELIIYGATEPDASVEIGGRTIKLRPDGTFSFRFILPDGTYDLPAQATSADGDDSRRAALRFSRSTDYQGDVGAHPQDPRMKPPLAANVS